MIKKSAAIFLAFFLLLAGVSYAKGLGLHLAYLVSTTASEKNTMMNFANDLGAQIVRFDVYLNYQGNPVLNFPFLDSLLAAASPDKEILFDVRFDHPSYLPSDINQYIGSIESLVARYKNRVKYWQIENEVYGAEKYGANAFWSGTKEDYVQLLNAAYAAIKSVDPDAKVLMAGIAIGGSTRQILPEIAPDSFLAYTFVSGNYDIVDLHLYYKYQLIPDRLEWLKRQMNNYGAGGKSFWVTENGGVDMRIFGIAIDDETSGYNTVEEEYQKQSEEVIKRFILSFAGGAEQVFWHKPYIKFPQIDGIWGHMALTSGESFAKKPAFYTYKLMSEKILGFTEISSLEGIDGGYKLKINDKSVFVLWNDSGPAVADLSSYVSTAKVKLTHIVTALDGSNLPIYPADEIVNANNIPATSEPVFAEEVNSAPVFNSIGNKATDEGKIIAFTISATDPDTGDTLTYSATGLPSGAVFDTNTKTFSWTPDYTQAGAYVVTFETDDNHGANSSEAITITVKAVVKETTEEPQVTKEVEVVNHVPAAEVQTAIVASGKKITLALKGYDPDGDKISYVITEGPLHGVILGTPPDIIYQPDAGYSGSDSFTFKVSDGTLESAAATVTITVNPPPSLMLATGGARFLAYHDSLDKNVMIFRYILDTNTNVKIVVINKLGAIVWQGEYLAGAEGGRGGSEGNYVRWNLMDSYGQSVSNGTYVYAIGTMDGGFIPIYKGKLLVMRP